MADHDWLTGIEMDRYRTYLIRAYVLSGTCLVSQRSAGAQLLAVTLLTGVLHGEVVSKSFAQLL